MVKRRFVLRIPSANSVVNPQSVLNRQTPSYVDLPDLLLPDIDIDNSLPGLRSINRRVPIYQALPKKIMYTDPPVLSSIPHSDYVQHRQMHEGREISLSRHPRKYLLSHVGNIWRFSSYIQGGYMRPSAYAEYQVNWDGLGDPPLGVSNTSFSSFAPDSFTWAVYFFVNGSPSDSQWLPIPSLYPTWNSLGIGRPLPEYNLTL